MASSRPREASPRRSIWGCTSSRSTSAPNSLGRSKTESSTTATQIPKWSSPSPDDGRFMRFLRRGKVKKVYEVSKTELEFVFTDQISVFDKVIPTLVPHKGETLCRTSAHWFKLVEGLGVRTHFLRVLDGNRMRVRRVQVIPDYDTITSKTKNFLIPLEVIARYYVAGSLHDRIKAGKIRPADAGVPTGHAPRYGEPLPKPFVEVTTKLEKVDRELTTTEALAISKLSPGEYDDLVKAVLKIDDRLNTEVRKRGLIHVDGKKEFVFFFQAEDGIRDLTVTGVQTCALPISVLRAVPPGARSAVDSRRRESTADRAPGVTARSTARVRRSFF